MIEPEGARNIGICRSHRPGAGAATVCRSWSIAATHMWVHALAAA